MSPWGTHEFDAAPDMDKAMLFVKNMARFYNSQGKKYLYGGRMSAKNDFECEEIHIPLFRGQKFSTLPRLLCSAWECESKKTAYVVVNPESNAVAFTLSEEKYECEPLNAMLILK